MKKRITYQSETVTLRQKAEALLERNSQKADTLPNEAGTLKLIHELQVHQIELEMQNQELIQAKARAEAATKRAEVLFDFAPCCYFTVTRNGKIFEVNQMGEKLLGKDRHLLIDKLLTYFITPSAKPIFNQFLYNAFKSKTIQSCDIEVLSDGKTSYIQLTGIVIKHSEYCLLTGMDITVSKRLNDALQENKSRLDLAMQVVQMAWWGMDLSNGNVTFGDKKAEMLGFPQKCQRESAFCQHRSSSC